MSEEETTILGGRVTLIQPTTGLRVTTDTVLLAAAAQLDAGDYVMDMGCGTGAAGLALKWRCRDIRLIGIDIQSSLITLAQKNAALNGWGDACSFECGDIRNQPHRTLDHIICNPPYMDDGAWRKGADAGRNTALGFDGEGDLQEWIAAIHTALKPGGALTIIHKAAALHNLLHHMHGHFGAIEIIPITPKIGENAKRIIIRAKKGRKTPLSLRPHVILHHNSGEYTAPIHAVLNDGCALDV